MRRIQASSLILALLAGCTGEPSPSPMCGLAMLTGPLAAIEGFGRGAGLSEAPLDLPPNTVARFVGGPTAPTLLSRGRDGELIASVDAPPPENSQPGFGILVVDRQFSLLGILINDGMAIRGASQLGTVEVGDTVLPLLGVSVTPTAIETPGCPIFPDD